MNLPTIDPKLHVGGENDAPYDEKQYLELATEENDIGTQLKESSDKLAQMYAKDGSFDENETRAYMVETNRHLVLGQQLELVRARRENMGSRKPEKKGDEEPVNSAFKRWLKSGSAELDNDEKERHLYELSDKERSGLPLPPNAAEVFKTTLEGTQAQATRSDANTGAGAAGLAVEERWDPTVMETLAYLGDVTRACYSFDTDTGGTYHVNQMDSVGEEGGSIDDQTSTGIDDDPLPPVKDIEYGAYVRHSKLIPVRIEALQDTHFSLAARSQREAYRRLGRGWNRWFTQGDDSNKPQGIVPSARVVDGEAGSINAISFENLLKLEYGVDLAYLNGSEGFPGGFMNSRMGYTGFMIHRSVEQRLRQQLDSDMRPIWTANQEVGVAAQMMPGFIMGYPCFINQHMQAMGTNGHKPILFGNFAHYGVRNVAEIMFYRFWDSRTVQRYSVEYIAFSRRDGRCWGPVDANDLAEAYNVLQIKT